MDEENDEFDEKEEVGGPTLEEILEGKDNLRGVTIKRNSPKVGRNEPCPCGSGKKFKRCHGA
jgi:preprotein translocase subunit SecA